ARHVENELSASLQSYGAWLSELGTNSILLKDKKISGTSGQSVQRATVPSCVTSMHCSHGAILCHKHVLQP
ncbi:hypothetical protein LEMLEM_LOCUS24506, partial [Lemmus lemmus]